MSNIVEYKKGRPKGSGNNKTYKWKVLLFDNESKSFTEGKYFSVNHINKELNLNLNSDYVRRIMTHYRADENMRNKNNSFLARYGHIKIEKINEPNTEPDMTEPDKPVFKKTEDIKEYKKQYRQSDKGKKCNRIGQWKKYALICDNYDELYDKYINTKNCEECNIELCEGVKGNGRCLDHDHNTGIIRNILCMNCNKKRR